MSGVGGVRPTTGLVCTQVRHLSGAMTWPFLLLFLASLSVCRGSDSCLLDSGQECKRSELRNDSNETLFGCILEQTPNKTRVKELDIWHNNNITAVGDWRGDGCSFEVYHKDRNITCCYIPDREKELERGELCETEKQPEECRKRGKESGQFEVVEKSGTFRYCILTLYDPQRSDDGDYKVKFPFKPKDNSMIRVRVNQPAGLSVAATSATGVFGCLLGFLVLAALMWFVIYPKCMKPPLSKIDQKQRERDGRIFEHLTKGEKKKFKSELHGRKSILGLRDEKHNNIFHMAARKNWTKEMTRMVLNRKKQEDSEAALLDIDRTEIFKELKLKPNVSRWTRFCSNPANYLWPNKWPHPTAHLNSKNLDGDTPLIIATREGQVDNIEALLGQNVDVNIANNKGDTPLINAAEKGQRRIVEQLLVRGASVDVSNEKGDTPLIVAAGGGHKEVVEKLLENRADGLQTVLMKNKRNKEGYTALHKTVAEYTREEVLKNEKGLVGQDLTQAYAAMKSGFIMQRNILKMPNTKRKLVLTFH